MKHLGTQYLETDRLILRQFTIDDAELMHKNWAFDSEVTKYLTWEPHQNFEVTQAILTDWCSHYKEDSYYQWAITLKENPHEAIGSIGVVKQIDDVIMSAHIGYCIGKTWWHLGITSEALARIMGFFFDEVGLNRIESLHDVNNPRSGSVMKKCGMKYEGTLRQSEWSNQGVYDACYYGILATER